MIVFLDAFFTEKKPPEAARCLTTEVFLRKTHDTDVLINTYVMFRDAYFSEKNTGGRTMFNITIYGAAAPCMKKKGTERCAQAA